MVMPSKRVLCSVISRRRGKYSAAVANALAAARRYHPPQSSALSSCVRRLWHVLAQAIASQQSHQIFDSRRPKRKLELARVK